MRSDSTPTAHVKFSRVDRPNGVDVVLHGEIPQGVRPRRFGSPEDLTPIAVRLKDQTLRYRWDARLPGFTNDALAAVSVLSFLPSIDPDLAGGSSVLCDWPLSGRAEDAFAALGNGIAVQGSGRTDDATPEADLTIAFGGGIDSRAAWALFPSASVVHEAPLSVAEGRITSSLIEKLGERVAILYTNQRELYTVWGLGAWPAVFAASLLTRPRSIVTGVNPLDSTYLGFGKGVPMRQRHKSWYRFFDRLGIRIVTTEYLSETCNARIVVSAGAVEELAYCPRIPFDDCGGCAKCIRRRTLFALADSEAYGQLLQGAKPTEAALAHLEERPLRWAHIYALALERGLLPEWMITRVIEQAGALEGRVGFQERYLREGMADTGLTETEQRSVESALTRHGVEPMTEHDRKNLARLTPT